MWIYDSRSIKDAASRRDFLRDKLKSKLEGYTFTIFLSDKEIQLEMGNELGSCLFLKE